MYSLFEKYYYGRVIFNIFNGISQDSIELKSILNIFLLFIKFAFISEDTEKNVFILWLMFVEASSKMAPVKMSFGSFGGSFNLKSMGINFDRFSNFKEMRTKINNSLNLPTEDSKGENYGEFGEYKLRNNGFKFAQSDSELESDSEIEMESPLKLD